MDRLGQSDLGPVQRGQIQPVLALDDLHGRPLLLANGGSHRLFDNPLVDFDQLGRVLDHARLGIADSGPGRTSS